jgi:hypothetical protein
MSVIPATQKVEMKRAKVQGQSGQNYPISTNKEAGYDGTCLSF